MKLAFISDAIYPYNLGGKEKRIYEVTTRLAKSGHSVHIYTMKWWKGKDVKLENGVYLHAISKKYALYKNQRRSIRQALMFSLNCFKLIKEDFDVIDADHMPHLVLFPLKIVAILKRKKLFVTWNEVWGLTYWVEYMGILGNVSYVIEKLSVLMPSEIISVSNHTSKKLVKELSFKRKINTIPNGIDFKKVQTIKVAAQKSDIIYAGRLLSHKNIDILIKAVGLLYKKNPNITCFIVGEGPEKKNLIKITKQAGLEKNIKFFDFFKSQNTLYSLIKASKVFVLPSTREGFGIVVIEANALGISVVTTNHKDNAAKDLINSLNGLTVSLEERNLADATYKLINKKVNKKALENFAKTYDWDKIAKKIEGVYKI